MKPSEVIRAFDELVEENKPYLSSAKAIKGHDSLELARALIENSGIKWRQVRLNDNRVTAKMGLSIESVSTQVNKASGQSERALAGTLFYVISKADSQTLLINTRKNISLSEFKQISKPTFIRDYVDHNNVQSFINDSDINSIGSQVHSENSFDSRRWTHTEEKSILKDPDDDRFFISDTLGLNEANLPPERLGNKGHEVVLSNSRLLTSSFYEALGFDESLNEKIAELISLQKDFLKNSLDEMLDDAFFAQNEKLGLVGIDKSDLHKDIYRPPLRNFIASGQSKKEMKHRKEFVDISVSLLLGVNPGDKFNELEKSKLNYDCVKRIADLIEGPNANDHEFVKLIDEGKYPAKEIGLSYGFESLSKQQFSRAMSMFGSFGPMTENHQEFLQMLTPETLADAFASSKIPKEWFNWNPNELLSAPVLKSMPANKINQLVRSLYSITPHLKNAGLALDKMQASGDKKGMKELAKQWNWLSLKGKYFHEKIMDLEAKHKLSETFDDYIFMISDQFKMVLFRTLSNVDGFDFSSDFSLAEDNSEIVIDEYGVNESIFYEDGPQAEKLRGLSELKLPGNLEIAKLINKGTSFKDLAEKNTKLHNGYNRYLTISNKGSDKNISWTPLVDEKINLGNGMFAEPLSTRLDLLSEGYEMNNCVFSYLNDCLAGETSLFSIKDMNGSEPTKVATAEVRLNETESGYELKLTQCYGVGNESTPLTKHLESVFKTWVEQANENKIKTNVKLIKNENGNFDFIEKAKAKPMKDGVMLCSIPFETDAAYLAYFNFNNNTPSNVSVDKIMRSNEAMYALYTGPSFFRKEIDEIVKLSSKLNIAPEKLVTYKIENKIKSISDVEPHYEKFINITKDLLDIVSKYKTELEPNQIAIKCAGYLSKNEGLSLLSLDDLAKEVSSTKPNFSSIVQELVMQKEDMTNSEPEPESNAPTHPKIR